MSREKQRELTLEEGFSSLAITLESPGEIFKLPSCTRDQLKNVWERMEDRVPVYKPPTNDSKGKPRLRIIASLF